jgi:hypothetical protein
MRYGRGTEIGLLSVSFFLMLGCAKDGRGVSANAVHRQQLEELGELYKVYVTQKKQPPGKMSDLNSYGPAFPNGMQALQTGQCVAIWNHLNKASTAPDAIFAYEKDAPIQGGYVLTRDGTVKLLTAEEFQTAPKR